MGEVGNGRLGQELLCHNAVSIDLQGEQSLGLETMGWWQQEKRLCAFLISKHNVEWQRWFVSAELLL